MSSFLNRPITFNPKPQEVSKTLEKHQRCPNFLAFLAILFEDTSFRKRGFHPVLSNAAHNFDDVSMGGFSFDVRKVRSSSFPTGLSDDLLEGRDFVVVKHPKFNEDNRRNEAEILSELATELQILRHGPVRQSPHIIDLLAVMYHDGSSDPLEHQIVPALVLEHADYGNLHDYQSQGYARTFMDKFNILMDIASGLETLHSCGIIHGDIKSSNILVYKHPVRKFVVKLSDFGFSSSTDDTSLMGFTKTFAAPEASQPLQQQYMRQLDIYSYGLLVYTVLKNGVQYFEAVPEEGREEHLDKIKETGILPSLLQTNLLGTWEMRDAKCGLLQLCNLLQKTLQPQPQNRLSSITDAIAILKAANCFEQSRVDNPINALTAGNNPQDTVFSQMRIVIGIYIDMYFASPQNQSHFNEPLKIAYKTRAEKEFNYALEDMRLELQRGVPPQEILASLQTGYVFSLYTLSSNPPAVTSTPAATGAVEAPAKLTFSKAIMPDLSEVQNVFKKSPALVKKTIVTELETAYHDSSSENSSDLLMNLAWLYMEGYVVDHSITKALDLIKEAAYQGSLKARDMYLHSLKDGSNPVDIEFCQGWVIDLLDNGYHTVWSLAKKFFPTEGYEQLRSDHDKAEACGVTGINNDTSINDEQSRLKLLRASVLTNDINSTKTILSEADGLLDQVLDGGETCLNASCRKGHFEMTKLLVESGANVNLGDANGVKPLHWIIRFQEKQIETIAKLLKVHGVDFNAAIRTDIRISREPLKNDSLVDGTALHWAIHAKNLKAVEVLLKLGADPLRQFNGGLSALELAVSRFDSSALELILDHTEDITLAVSTYRPLSEGLPVTIQPLFFATSDITRWEMIRWHGLDYVSNIDGTIELLTKYGSPVGAVLKAPQAAMTSMFAISYHDTSVDIMRAGLKHGFDNYLDSKFGTASSGGTPLFLAVSHENKACFVELIKAGANLRALDQAGMNVLQRACKETDDIFYVQTLYKADPKLIKDESAAAPPFWIAMLKGNLVTAQWLIDHGVNKHEKVRLELTGSLSNIKYKYVSTLGNLVYTQTRNSAQRVEFILNLPDSGDDDGFIAMVVGEEKTSILHMAVPGLSEQPADVETSRLIMSHLLQRYNKPEQINSTLGPHEGTVIGMAAEIGNWKIVQALLERGADPNIADKFGRTPLDLARKRYYYPHISVAFQDIDLDDELLVRRTVEYVNENTAEILSLLEKAGAKSNSFVFPSWYSETPGYRPAEWVLLVLRAKREDDKKKAIASSERSTEATTASDETSLPPT